MLGPRDGRRTGGALTCTPAAGSADPREGDQGWGPESRGAQRRQGDEQRTQKKGRWWT